MIVDIRADRSGRPLAPSLPAGPARPADDLALGPTGFDHNDRDGAEISWDDTPAAEETIDTASARRRWAMAAAVIVALGWIAAIVGYVTWSRPLLLPGDIAGLIAAAAAGPILVGIAWLIALRTSRSEARRFAGTAEAMRAEARRLDERMAAATRSIASGRAELAAQIDALAQVGEAAAARMATLGHDIASETANADDHARRLVDAAAAAATRIEALLTTMPRARDDTAALVGALDAAGGVAGRQVEELATHLIALTERGREAEIAVAAAAGTLAGRMGEIAQVSDAGATRLEGAAGAMVATVDTLLGRTADTLADARAGLERQGEAMLAMLSAHREALDGAASTSADALIARIHTIEASIAQLAERLEGQRLAGDGLVAGLETGIDRVGRQLDALHDQGVDRSQLLAASISALGGSADAMTEALRAGEAMATRTIGTTETLLIALDSAAREIDETLPDALARLDARIGQSKSVVVQAKPELLALVTAAESTHDAIEAIAGVIYDQRRTLEQLSTNLGETLTSGHAKAEAMGRMFDDTLERANRFAEDAAPRLIEALLRVRETAAAAADHARTTLASVIPEASDALGTAAARAMEAATNDALRRQIDAVAEASDAAVEAATRATERLAGQVRSLSEQTAIVEARIEDERTERENADRDNVSRRVAQLIESLHSASIDITRAFSPDIADSAWTAYLKGDRGVFTRRAVRILDAGEARDVLRLYDGDAAFRDQVNRYIHDFEAMLRQVLTQRDGSPLAVTLLSSDMGKLYVALAQAIERLR